MLKWRKTGDNWHLICGKRKFGSVVPDANHPGMWRVVLHDGRLSDMANLTRARGAILDAAERELEYAARLKLRAAPTGVISEGIEAA